MSGVFSHKDLRRLSLNLSQILIQYYTSFLGIVTEKVQFFGTLKS